MALNLQFSVPTGQTVITTRNRIYTAVAGVVTVTEPSGTDITDLLSQGCVPLEGGAVTAVTASFPLASSGGATPNLTVGVGSEFLYGVVRADGSTIDADAGILSIANGFAPQPAAASGGPVVTTTPTLASYGYTQPQAEAIITLLNNIRAALVANGIMS